MANAALHILRWPGVEKLVLSQERNGDPRLTLRHGAIYISRVFVEQEIAKLGSFDLDDLSPLLKQWEGRESYNYGYERISGRFTPT